MRTLLLVSTLIGFVPVAIAQEWTPTSVETFELSVDSSGVAAPFAIALEAGELFELDLDYGYRPDVWELVYDDGTVLESSSPPSRLVERTVVASRDGALILASQAPFGPGSARGTVSRFGTGELEVASGSLCADAGCAARHDYEFRSKSWSGDEWWEVAVEVEAETPVYLEVVRAIGDTLRASGRAVSVGPFTHTDELEYKDGPIQVHVRRASDGTEPQDYVVRVRRWAYRTDTPSTIPPPPPPPAPERRSDGGS